jgi:hypothetical protein
VSLDVTTTHTPMAVCAKSCTETPPACSI